MYWDPLAEHGESRVLGYDFAGVVEAIGPGVTRLSMGDDVLGVDLAEARHHVRQRMST